MDGAGYSQDRRLFVPQDDKSHIRMQIQNQTAPPGHILPLQNAGHLGQLGTLAFRNDVSFASPGYTLLGPRASSTPMRVQAAPQIAGQGIAASQFLSRGIAASPMPSSHAVGAPQIGGVQAQFNPHDGNLNVHLPAPNTDNRYAGSAAKSSRFSDNVHMAVQSAIESAYGTLLSGNLAAPGMGGSVARDINLNVHVHVHSQNSGDPGMIDLTENELPVKRERDVGFGPAPASVGPQGMRARAPGTPVVVGGGGGYRHGAVVESEPVVIVSSSSESDDDDGGGDVISGSVHSREAGGAKNPFMCHVCRKVFNNKKGLIVHMRKQHGQGLLDGDEGEGAGGGMASAPEGVLQRHDVVGRYSPGGKPKFECELCFSTSFNNKRGLFHHMQTRHKVGQSAVELGEVTRSGRLTSPPPLDLSGNFLHRFECGPCSEVFSSYQELASHMTVRHQPRKVAPTGAGPEGGGVAKDAGALSGTGSDDEEVAMDTDAADSDGNATEVAELEKETAKPAKKERNYKQRYTCVHCGIHFNRPWFLARHVKRTHKVLRKKRRGGILSGKSAKVRPRVATETGDGRNASYRCDQCGRSFFNFRGLSSHVVQAHRAMAPEGGATTPLPEISGPTTCTVCKREFRSVQILQRHKVISHRTGQVHRIKYSCRKCCKVFVNLAVLRKHMSWCTRGSTESRASTRSTDEKRSAKQREERLTSAESRASTRSTDEKRSAKQREERLTSAESRASTRSTDEKRSAKPRVERKTSAESGRKVDRASLRCKLCGNYYSSAHSHKRHMEEVHRRIIRRRCYVCSRVLAHKGALHEHLGSVHGDVYTFQCNFCLARFRSKEQLTSHKEKHNRRYQCIICSQTFRLVLEMKSHVERAHAPETAHKIGPSDPDGKHTANDDDMDKLKTKSPVSTTTSAEAARKTEPAEQEQAHEVPAGRGRGRKYGRGQQCALCYFTGESEMELREHQTRAHTGPGHMTCKHLRCGRRFANPLLLQRHCAREHPDVYRYQCNHCNKVYRADTKLVGHRVFHNRCERPYFCLVCAASFKKREELVEHLRTTHRYVEENLTCGICQHFFFTQAHLDRHMVLDHRSKKAYQCRLCERTFIMQYSLQNHLKTHGSVADTDAGRAGKGERTDTEETECGRRNEAKSIQISQKRGDVTPALRRPSCDRLSCAFCDKQFKSPLTKIMHERTHDSAASSPEKSDAGELRRAAVHGPTVERAVGDKLTSDCRVKLYDVMTSKSVTLHDADGTTFGNIFDRVKSRSNRCVRSSANGQSPRGEHGDQPISVSADVTSTSEGARDVMEESITSRILESSADTPSAVEYEVAQDETATSYTGMTSEQGNSDRDVTPSSDLQASSEGVHVTGDAVPVRDQVVPSDDGATSSSDPVRPSSAAVPNILRVVRNGAEGVPGSAAVPNIWRVVPNSAEGVPKNADGVPRSVDALYLFKDGVPNSQDAVPSNQDAVPSTQGSMPASSGAVSVRFIFMPNPVAADDVTAEGGEQATNKEEANACAGTASGHTLEDSQGQAKHVT